MGTKQVGPHAHETPSSSTPLEVVTQTPISSTQAPYVPIAITRAPSIIHFNKLQNNMLLKTNLAIPLLSCCHVCLSY